MYTLSKSDNQKSGHVLADGKTCEFDHKYTIFFIFFNYRFLMRSELVQWDTNGQNYKTEDNLPNYWHV